MAVEYYVSPTGFYVGITWLTVYGIIATVTTIAIIYQLLHSHQNKPTKKSIKIAHIICCISCTLPIWIDLSRFLLCLLTKVQTLWTGNNESPYTTSDIFYYIGSISFYIIAILKVYFSFKGSAFEIKPIQLIIVICFITLSMIVSIYYCVWIAAWDYIPNADAHLFNTYESPAIYTLMVFDFCLNFGLLSFFLYKLYQVIKLQLSNSETSLIDNQHANRFIDVMIKHSLLFGIAIISNQLWFIGLIFMLTTGKFQWYIFIFRGTECLVNVIALFLNLKYNKDIYMKLCFACHNGMQFLFIKSIHNKGNNVNNVSQDHYVTLVSNRNEDDQSS